MKSATSITDMGAGIFCLRAANPGPMTGTGTNTYLLRSSTGAVLIDPGPNLDAHLRAILAALGNLPLSAILMTHAHLDHTALTPRLVTATAAPVFAFGAANAGRSARMQALAAQQTAGSAIIGGSEGVDAAFKPDFLLVDGQTVGFAGLDIGVIHTPGHMGGHLCFAYGNDLFSGDHVMGWSTSLISPPDGDMTDYLASLARLAVRHWVRFLPGHGAPIADPAARLDELIAHRRAREAAILAALRGAPATAHSLTALIYTNTPPALLPAAARNIMAHLIDLEGRNLITTKDAITPTATFSVI